MNSSLLRFVLPVALGIAAGAAVGYFFECNSGTCPLTATWWRGALAGGVIGLIIALGNRSP